MAAPSSREVLYHEHDALCGKVETLLAINRKILDDWHWWQYFRLAGCWRRLKKAQKLLARCQEIEREMALRRIAEADFYQ